MKKRLITRSKTLKKKIAEKKEQALTIVVRNPSNNKTSAFISCKKTPGFHFYL